MADSLPALEVTPTAPPPQGPRAKLEPISEELRTMRITFGHEFANDLARARNAFGGDYAHVIHHCLRVALEQHERKKRGTGRAQRRTNHARGRYLAAALRDAVWRRDEHRCAFVGANGVRCTATERLEIHHIVPFAKGGAATLDNLSLRCRAHNRYHADQDFGREHVAQAIAAKKKSRADAPDRRPGRPGLPDERPVVAPGAQPP